MLDVIEGDFCTHGINVVLDAVKDDVRSVAVFGRPIICICTRAIHTPTCVTIYHQRQQRVAPEVAAAFFETELQVLRRRPNLVREIRDMLTLGGPPAFAIIASTDFAAAGLNIVERWAAKTLSAQHLLLIAPSLSSAAMIEATDRCVGDVAAATACREYVTWLFNDISQPPYHQRSPLHVVAATAALAIQHMPAEIVHAILALVLPAPILAAWQVRQKHVPCLRH